MLSPKFHTESVYDKKYIKAKVKTFNDIVNKVFWNDKIPKENGNNKYWFCHEDG